MKYRLLTSGNEHRLLLIFAGWGMDDAPLRGLTPPAGYDLAVAWDYRDLDLPDFTNGYDEICVIAWSFGVAAAHHWMTANRHLPVTRRTAIGGTLHPVDDILGIPTIIFRGTLDSLSADNLTRFYRRMAGSGEAYREFAKTLPERCIEELADELRAISALPPVHENAAMEWDEVYILTDDRIIPPQNQRNAWNGNPAVIELQSAHLPDFSAIIPRAAMCKATVKQRFAAGSATYDESAGVQNRITALMTEMWLKHGKPGADGNIVEIGTGTGQLTRRYAPLCSTCLSMTSVDLTEPSPALPGRKIACDGELFVRSLPDASVDIIFTASTIQWFNSPREFLRQCARILPAGGTVLLSTFGPDNYREIRSIASSLPRYMSAIHVRAILPEELVIEESHEELCTLEFDTTAELLHHIRQTGVNVTEAAPDKAFGAALALARSGIKRLTYNPVILMLRRR